MFDSVWSAWMQTIQFNRLYPTSTVVVAVETFNMMISNDRQRVDYSICLAHLKHT